MSRQGSSRAGSRCTTTLLRSIMVLASVSESGDQSAAEGRPQGGALMTAISNRIVGLLREHYGRGPMKALPDKP